MKLLKFIRFSVMAVTGILFQISLLADTIQLSFLNVPSALEETTKFLTANGCNEDSVGNFKKAVENYYAAGFNIDIGRFPKVQNGFYAFTNVQTLLSALPHRLQDTDHDWGINCFDTVILLGAGSLHSDLSPDEISGPFMVTMLTTNGEEVHFEANARDAFNRVTRPWYRDLTSNIFPQQFGDDRICLNAALFGWHLLPSVCRDENLENNLLDVLKANWKLDKLAFPKHFQVVLCHTVDLSEHTTCTGHAGLLFHHKMGYTYIEKSSGSGPFVRLDFVDLLDLSPWLKAKYIEPEIHARYLFATFNDESIVRLVTK